MLAARGAAPCGLRAAARRRGRRRLLGTAAPRAFGETSRHREAVALRRNRKAKAPAAGNAQARVRGFPKPAPPPRFAGPRCAAPRTTQGVHERGRPSLASKAEVGWTSGDLEGVLGPRSPRPSFWLFSLPRVHTGYPRSGVGDRDVDASSPPATQGDHKSLEEQQRAENSSVTGK